MRPWTNLLSQWSDEWLRTPHPHVHFPQEAVETRWLGYPRASSEGILQAESRIGAVLPPSYKEFLSVTNGWRQTTEFVQNLLPTEKIDWMKIRHPEARATFTDFSGEEVPDEEYFVYGEEQRTENIRYQYMRNALEISEWFDGGIYLLIPDVVTPEGEWEAWFYATWYPGATRYRSFWDLMVGEHENFIRLKNKKV